METHRATAGGRRADAKRNRERILAAARLLYATEGLDISMASVARKAGVGKATLSRHFATPGELIDASFADRMDAYVQVTSVALTSDDPWAAFVDYVWTVCEMQARDRGFADVLTLALPGAEEFEARRAQAYAGFLKIIERAKATGHLRADFTSSDMVLLLMANAGVVAATTDAAPDSWQRLVAQVLRAWATASAPERAMPDAPSSVDLHRAMTRHAPQRRQHLN